MRAIAAMARNRVIGKDGDIPWRIPEEFRFFRRTTMGSFLVMGRRTYESLPRPLDGRVTIVLTRDPERLRGDPATAARYADAIVGEAALRLTEPPRGRAEVRLVDDLEALERAGITGRAFLCGGAQLYERYLDRCAELFLSVIDRDVDGDVRFPPFEHLFDLQGVAAESAEFRVLHYVRK